MYSPFALTTLCLALLAPAAKSELLRDYFNTTPARRSLLAKQTLYSIEIREAQLVVAGGALGWLLPRSKFVSYHTSVHWRHTLDDTDL